MLDVLLGVAQLRAAVDELIQAVEWLALSASHPNGDWETKQKAQKALAEIEGKLSTEEFSAAQARGRNAELETVILAVLARLA